MFTPDHQENLPDPMAWTREHLKLIPGISKNIKNEGLCFALAIVILMIPNSLISYWFVKDTIGLIIYLGLLSFVLIVACISLCFYFRNENDESIEEAKRKAKKIVGENR